MKKIVIITGVSSGMGKATALLFAEKGYHVIGTVRDVSRIDPKEYGKNITFLELDIGSSKSIEDFYIAYTEKYDAPDILINNAGYGIIAGFENATEEQYRAQFEVNYFGTVHLTRKFLPLMRASGKGSIVTTTSIGGRIAFPFFGYYNATKHALEASIESLWYELGESFPRVKIIEPGFTQTGFATKGMVQGSIEQEYTNSRMQKLGESMQTGTTGTPPEALARLIFEASEDTSRRLRYAGGKLAKPLLLLRRFLPERLFQKLIEKYI